MLYRDQIKPEAATAICCGYEIASGGIEKSETFAIEMPHLNVGAQKWMVLGPVGWFQSAETLKAMRMDQNKWNNKTNQIKLPKTQKQLVQSATCTSPQQP